MNLKAFLKLFNISNKNFAKEIGVSAVSLSRYIIGERVPEKKILNKIFHKTNGLVDANDFFIEKENNEDLDLEEEDEPEVYLNSIDPKIPPQCLFRFYGGFNNNEYY